MYHSNMFNGSSLLALKEGTMRPQGLQAVAISYIWNPLQPYQTSLVKKKWVQSIKMDLHQEWNYPLISGRLPMCHVIEPVTHILDGSIYMWYTVVWQMWNIMSHCMANLSIRKMIKSTWKMELSNPSRAQRRSMAKPPAWRVIVPESWRNGAPGSSSPWWNLWLYGHIYIYTWSHDSISKPYV